MRKHDSAKTSLYEAILQNWKTSATGLLHYAVAIGSIAALFKETFPGTFTRVVLFLMAIGHLASGTQGILAKDVDARVLPHGSVTAPEDDNSK